MISLPIPWPAEEINDFCKKWLVLELSLFGSILRNDFHADSDVDLLITYKPDSKWSLFDCVEMQIELTEILGRKVDLISERAIQKSHNYIRRNNILSTAEVVYSDKVYAKK